MRDVTVDPPAECEKIPEESIVGVRYKAHLENGEVLEDLEDLKVIFKSRGIVYGLYILMKEMCVGHSYQTKIPPHHGYGEKGVEGYIPSSAMLYIDLEIKEWWPQMDDHLVAECDPEVTFTDCDKVKCLPIRRQIFYYQLKFRWVNLGYTSCDKKGKIWFIVFF